ncbi:MAG TPA: M23 family metallopeptidase [Gemmatimonadales bacterium]|nr:M23 family metallopeptidase [Gemmatimonadales bacterium]
MTPLRFAAWITAVAAPLCPLRTALGQDTLPRVIITSNPAPLTEGAVGWLMVRLAGTDSLSGGEARGEPIHFQPAGSEREYRAIVAAPIESTDSLPVALYLSRDSGGVDTVAGAVAVRQAGYPREVLAVAPKFAKPDSVAAARVRRENARSRQVSLASRTRARLWHGPFRLPRASRITSVFGAARVYNGEVKSRHLGTDFAGAVGTPVLAAGRGVVAMVADFYLAGKAVYVDHGQGMVTAYFHLSRADVTAGDTVTAGQRIGAVGQSGRVTGPHLHWVARFGTIAVDPMSLLALEKGEAAGVSGDSSSRAQ